MAFQKWGQYLWLALPCEPLSLLHAHADLTGVFACLWDEVAAASSCAAICKAHQDALLAQAHG